MALVVVAKEKMDSASGSRKRAVSAKAMKTKPPIMVTVRTEMRWAINLPPITARLVHRAWPSMPAITTAHIFSLAAKTMVAN